MMRKITGNSIGHNLPTTNFPKSKDFICTTCATGKMILRPSHLKIKAEPLKFLGKNSRRYLWANYANFRVVQVLHGIC
jgi:hypothetical protein